MPGYGGLVDVGSLVTARYPLEELATAFEHAIDPGSMRIVVGE